MLSIVSVRYFQMIPSRTKNTGISVRSTTDWKTHFGKNSIALLGSIIPIVVYLLCKIIIFFGWDFDNTYRYLHGGYLQLHIWIFEILPGSKCPEIRLNVRLLNILGGLLNTVCIVYHSFAFSFIADWKVAKAVLWK